ncbi:MAG: hypothetical protein V4667_09255 [Bacteroidota bacterium]
MKRIIGVILLLFLLNDSSFAQVKYNKTQKKVYSEAVTYYDAAEYFTAYEKFKDIYKIDSLNLDLNYYMGACLFNIRGRELESKPYIDFAVKNNNFEALFYQARTYHFLERFDEALTDYQNYLSKEGIKRTPEEVSNYIKISQRAKEMVKKPINVNISNVGTNINTSSQDFGPLVTSDESTMFFTSRRQGSTGNLKDPFDQYFEDVYVSQKADGRWGLSNNIGVPINSDTHDAVAGISANGNVLIIYRTNKELTGGDLYTCEFKDGNWQQPVLISKAVNSGNYEPSACLTNDENMIYFSSTRPGGFGGKDLYKCSKLPNGEWGIAQNLGPTINTELDEDAPFITADGKSLYFASTGHTTMGGFDIFKTDVDTVGVWNLPENLGFPINSVEDDIYFSIVASGKVAYYSSKKGIGFGGQDIYKIEFLSDEDLQTIVKGKVFDELTKEPVKAKITLIDQMSEKVAGIYNSNRKNGNYVMVVESLTSYQMIVEAPGFETKIESFEIEDTGKRLEINLKDVFLKQKKGK